MKNKGFGHQENTLFTIVTSNNVGLGGPSYTYRFHLFIYAILLLTYLQLQCYVYISCIIIFTVFQEIHGFEDFSRVVKSFYLLVSRRTSCFLLP